MKSALRGVLIHIFICKPSFCILGNFSYFCIHLLTFLKINFKKKTFQEHYQSALGLRLSQGSVSPDSSPKLFANVISR